MEKRYQVFVSSTFRDLEKERSEVIQALLELDCIPCGMELFPAADEDQWSYIQGIIDDCDYYVVVLAGKYGSLSTDTGKSYTQMEYEYALSKGKPTIAFLYKNLSALPVESSETDVAKRELLEKFRSEVQTKLCKYWENADQLHGVVLQSMIHLIKRRPAIGWVRADLVADESAAQEIARLRRMIEELEEEKEQLTSGVAGLSSEDLQQGKEYVALRFAYSALEYEVVDGSESDDENAYWKGKTTTIGTNWEDIITTLAPTITHKVREEDAMAALNELLYRRRPSWRGGHISDLCIIDDYFQIVKTQVRALGFVEVTNSDSFPPHTYWKLTQKGDVYVLQTMAAKKRGEQ